MANTFLKNFKSLITKQYQLDLSDSVKMKAALYKFKREFELKEAATLSRFPKKELKNFIKIECPINTGDENLKEQEVITGLKRLRAMHGVKESLVCQNCSKRSTCKVANQVPEDIDNNWKGGMSDMFTSLYYFAREVEHSQSINQENTSAETEQQETQKKNKQNSSKEKKADISVEKYRECQRESSFYKSCSSATKLTDTMHVVLEDLHSNLGIDSKRFLNEYLEEEQRRRFMERLFKKFESEITAQNNGKKVSKKERDDDDDDDEEEGNYVKAKSEHPLEKKNKKFAQSKNKLFQNEQEDLEQDIQSEDPFADGDFVQVEGRSKQNKREGLFNRIIAEDKESAYEVKQAVKREKDFNRENTYKKEGKQHFKQGGDRRHENSDNYRGDKKDAYRDGSNKYDRVKSTERSYERYPSNKKNYREDFDADNSKQDRHPRRKEWQERNNSKDTNSYDRYAKRETSQHSKPYEKQPNQTSKKEREQKQSHHQPSQDWVKPIDQQKMSRFMFKDTFEQKQQIQQEQVEKQFQKEERKAKKFERDVQEIQEVVQSSEDVLNREVDRKRQPKFSRGSFKFSKTTKRDNQQQ